MAKAKKQPNIPDNLLPKFKIDYYEWDYEVRMANIDKCKKISERAQGEARIYIENEYRVYFNNSQMAVVDFIRECPIEMRTRIVHLTEEDMMELINEKKKKLSIELLKLLSKKWLWRMDDAPVQFEDLPLCGNKEAMKKKCKRLSYSLKELNEIIYKTILGDRSEMYCKDE